MKRVIIFLAAILAAVPAFADNSVPIVLYAPPKAATVLASSGAALNNTGISTTEVHLGHVAIPPLGPNDSIRITALWNTAGTATDTKHLWVRYGTAAGTPGQTCSAQCGTGALNVTLNSASLISASTLTIIRNANATNIQVFQSQTNTGIGTVGATNDSGVVETNAGGFINFDCTTTTATTDACSLIGYTIELVPGA